MLLVAQISLTIPLFAARGTVQKNPANLKGNHFILKHEQRNLP